MWDGGGLPPRQPAPPARICYLLSRPLTSMTSVICSTPAAAPTTIHACVCDVNACQNHGTAHSCKPGGQTHSPPRQAFPFPRIVRLLRRRRRPLDSPAPSDQAQTRAPAAQGHPLHAGRAAPAVLMAAPTPSLAPVCGVRENAREREMGHMATNQSQQSVPPPLARARPKGDGATDLTACDSRANQPAAPDLDRAGVWGMGMPGPCPWPCVAACMRQQPSEPPRCFSRSILLRSDPLALASRKR